MVLSVLAEIFPGNRGVVSVKDVLLREDLSVYILNIHVVKTGLSSEDRWGTLVYINDAGEQVTEKVPVGSAEYGRVYDSLIDAIENGGEKCIKDHEVVFVLETLEKGSEVAING